MATVLLVMCIVMTSCCKSQSDAQQSTDVTACDTTEPIYDTESTEEVTDQPIKQTFDKDQVYQHVFSEHSRKLTAEEVAMLHEDSFDGIETNAKEAIVGFVMDCEIGFSFDTATYEEYYIVKDVTTDMQGSCDKYVAAINQYSQPHYLRGTVSADYHEAYLDVMFENLTYTACQAIPDTEDLIYNIGYICTVGANTKYQIRSDGYVYYEDEIGSYQSEQRVDAAYLSSLMIVSVLNQQNNANQAKPLDYLNHVIDVNGEYYECEEGTLLVDENRCGYDLKGDTWLAYFDKPVGEADDFLLIYANRSVMYRDVTVLGSADTQS